MLRALLFFIKISLFVAVVVWVGSQPGEIDLVWQDYEVTVALGLFLLALLAVVVVAVFSYQLVSWVLALPRRMRERGKANAKEKGYRALTLGLSAVAAGDRSKAVAQARRAHRLLGEEHGLSGLLQAQAARLDGREEDAIAAFAHLLGHKDTAFLGMRGLLQTALDEGDYAHALELARRAQDLYPRQKWILQIVYDLELRQKLWDDALRSLKLAMRYKYMAADKIKSDRCALFIAKGDDAGAIDDLKAAQKNYQLAFDERPDFAPAAVRLSEVLRKEGDSKQGRKILQRAWKVLPHPDLIYAWQKLGGDALDLGVLPPEDAEHAWVCEQTGRVYNRYMPVSEPQGYFNTIYWGEPEAIKLEISAPRSDGVLGAA